LVAVGSSGVFFLPNEKKEANPEEVDAEELEVELEELIDIFVVVKTNSIQTNKN